jgi:hypothetical protein
MDAKGARALARRLGANAGRAAPSAPVDVPPGSLPLYSWVGGGAAAPVTEPSSPAKAPLLRRLRSRGR